MIAGSGELFFFKDLLLYLVLTLLLVEMLDVARYGQHGGKVHHLCHGS
jgi:hypothetical protein